MEEEVKISKKLMISCADAAMLVTLKEIGDITLYQRLQLFIHNIPCTLCKLWAKDSLRITKIFKNTFNAEKHCMCEEKKAALEKELEDLAA